MHLSLHIYTVITCGIECVGLRVYLALGAGSLRHSGTL